MDFGVNSKRLNCFILSLKGRGFKADAITAERFPDYFKQNMLNVPSRIVQSDPIGLGSRVFTEGDGVADTTPYSVLLDARTRGNLKMTCGVRTETKAEESKC